MTERDELVENLEPEELELFEKLEHVIYAKPEEAKIPEGWKELCECPPMEIEGKFHFEYLQGGIALGAGWRRPYAEPFKLEAVARGRAWESCTRQGNPTRVIRTEGTKEYMSCLFYKKDKKVFICLRLPSGQIIEQETRDTFDTTGLEEPKVKKEEPLMQELGKPLQKVETSSRRDKPPLVVGE